MRSEKTLRHRTWPPPQLSGAKGNTAFLINKAARTTPEEEILVSNPSIHCSTRYAPFYASSRHNDCTAQRIEFRTLHITAPSFKRLPTQFSTPDCEDGSGPVHEILDSGLCYLLAQSCKA